MPGRRRVTDQPFASIWTETDDLATMAREFGSKGGICLQDHEDHQFWMIEGYLVTLLKMSPQVRPLTPIPKFKWLKTLLTALGLAVLFGLFAFLFIGTLLVMSMHR